MCSLIHKEIFFRPLTKENSTLKQYLCRAVRQTMKSKEHPDVQAAVLAVHVGMIEEAEQILIGQF